ncbi:zinc ribbon domain-containing protein [Polyangium fumosum]|uniref:Zinc ribbon domain-containing protein n=1 Tax=Polyangium fumosum TaxID=889272 RepID=A0A4U1J7M3_9BACT|nr:zinc ribbon domain-containing protein [Polyangium fumosum]TKD02777.1 zinc ribbon domain-containing protein [Polyangium fumosum]
MHCPECGTKRSPGAATCGACGFALATLEPAQKGAAVARTMMGVSLSDLAKGPNAAQEVDPDAPTRVMPGAKNPAKPVVPPPPENRTIVGMPALAPSTGAKPTPAQAPAQTLLGVAAPKAAAAGASPAVKAPPPAEGTLLGVARPGIAPLRATDPSAEPARAGRAREMPHELGATIVPEVMERLRGANHARPPARDRDRDKLARKRLVLPPVQPRGEIPRERVRKNRRRALPVILTAGLLVVFAGVFAVLYTSPPPLTARVQATPEGREAVEIECPSCPDGTKVQIHAASADVKKHVALVTLPAPLALGENRLKVSLDRPGSGRDESVGVTVHVSYRLRPDLTGLANEKPSVHVAVEAVGGTEITIDGKPAAVKDGPAVHVIDVASDCTGPADEPATLKRRVPYVVKTEGGAREEGAVDVAVGIVPLHIDAPGARVIVEGETFVLAGRTMKGAEVLAAGKPIQVSADGSFAQRMSVSSVGSTNIEVRAKAPGMAPRIVPIAVRRVEKLAAAAHEFMADKPLGYAAFAAAQASDVGKPAVVSGEIVDARTQNHQTIFLLDVPVKEGCPKGQSPCRVRLVHGFPNPAKAGEVITAYGQLGKPWSAPGSSVVPEIQVAFTMPGERR